MGDNVQFASEYLSRNNTTHWRTLIEPTEIQNEMSEFGGAGGDVVVVVVVGTIIIISHLRYSFSLTTTKTTHIE